MVKGLLYEIMNLFNCVSQVVEFVVIVNCDLELIEVFGDVVLY